MAYTTINNPTDYFNTILYTGNGTDDRSISGVGFQPDWLWIKERDQTREHIITTSSWGSTNYVSANAASGISAGANIVQAFESDGFQLGTDAGVNLNTGTYVAWNWLLNGGTTASNTDGAVTTTVQANTTSGISLVSWTGNASAGTRGHGLGSVPKVIIARKTSSSSDDWFVYHYALGNTYNFRLNGTGAAGTGTEWNNTTPTSSVFSVGANDGINASGSTIYAWCIADVKGFSKAFSYIGNGSTDGPFTYLGFKPAWLFIVSKGPSGYQRFIWDTKRDAYNLTQNPVTTGTGAEPASASGYRELDILSNGIKIRASLDQINTSGQEYIGFAFAEAPLVGTNDIPATAR